MCLKSVSKVDSFGTAESSILGKFLCITNIIDILMTAVKMHMLSSVDKMSVP